MADKGVRKAIDRAIADQEGDDNERYLDKLQWELPAAGALTGAVVARRASRAWQKADRSLARRDASLIRNMGDDEFRYGRLQKEDELADATERMNRPIKSRGTVFGAIEGGIVGTGANNIMAEVRNKNRRRK